jgi:RNA polymerase sigma-70 factor (ECF subfamily)
MSKMKKYVALMLIFLLGCNLSVSRAEEKTLTIATNNYYAMMETMEQFEQESGIAITCNLSVDMMDTISTAYVIKNPDVDLFLFNTYDGLYTLKNMNYYAPLTAYARLFLNGNWAQDVVQDVFVNVWVRREALDPGQSLYGYLLRSVYNQSVNYVNKHRHACSYRSYYQERIESIGYAYYDPDRNPVIEKLYSQDLRTSINEAIAALPAKCREVFSLSYLQGFSHREISERMGIAQSTVENHIYLALRQLRAKLSKSELILLLFFIFLQNNSHPLG